MLQEVFNLDEGPVTLTVPATLSEASYADLADQFELFLRRAKRRIAKMTRPPTEAAYFSSIPAITRQPFAMPSHFRLMRS